MSIKKNHVTKNPNCDGNIVSRYELPESEALEAAANNASALSGNGVLGLPDPRNLKVRFQKSTTLKSIHYVRIS